jgi:hypothetical protein
LALKPSIRAAAATEALQLLRNRLPSGGVVVAPLSYGKAPRGYVGAVVEALGERFQPLPSGCPFMPTTGA